MDKNNIIVILIAVIVVGYIYFNQDNQTPVDLETTMEIQDVDTTPGAVLPEIFPVSHASFVMTFGDTTIFNDPVGDAEAYTKYSTPDIILLSDTHGDHFDIETLEAISTDDTQIVAPAAVIAELSETLIGRSITMENGESIVLGGIDIEAIPMYNLPEQGIEIRHEKGQGNGYLLNTASEKIYIAGDTANIPEMQELEGITRAFIPMNLPYTMSVEDAAAATLTIAPKRVYPYHYRTPEGFSDITRFAQLVSTNNPDIEVVLLDWYEE